MTSKIKALGFALLAIGAMSVVIAQPVRAGNGALHAELIIGPQALDITAEQSGTQHKFTLTNSGLETVRTEANFEETVANQTEGEQFQATEVTLTPRYIGCQSQGPFGAEATVDMNGCEYTITGGESELTAQGRHRRLHSWQKDPDHNRRRLHDRRSRTGTAVSHHRYK